MKPSWVPPLEEFQKYQGNWEKYVEALYKIFKHDFILNRTLFHGKNIGIISSPRYDNKEYTFWHIISEGEIEEERIPNLRRCARIRWPKAIIESNETDPILRIWQNRRGKDKRLLFLLSFNNEDYLVVLLIKRYYFIFHTSYPIDYPHTKRKLIKEYNDYKAKTASI